MKKVFSVLTAAILIFAAGCGNRSITESKVPPPLPEAFTANLKVNYGETSMTAVFNQKSFDEYELKMLTPEILSPLTLLYGGTSCTVTYDGLKFETELDRFPQVSFGTLLTETLKSIKDGVDIQATYSNGIWTYKGTGERGIFVFTRDEKSGAWSELSIEGAQLHIVFENYKA